MRGERGGWLALEGLGATMGCLRQRRGDVW